MTKKILASIAATCWLAIMPAAADCPLADPADRIYVDDDCVTNPGTGTELDPFCAIQSAYDSVVGTTSPVYPATILVRAGTYNECVDAATTFDFDPAFNEDRPVHLVADEWLNAGAPHPDPADPSSFETVAQMTTISGLGVCDGVATPRAPALVLAGTGASVEGFAITAGGGAGVVGLGAVTISDNLVFMNEGDLGGGVQVTTQICTYGDVTSVITFNVVRDNLALDFDEFGAGDGGGIFVGADGSDVDFACVGGKSDVTTCDNIVHDNAAQNSVIVGVNDTFTGGGGLSVETFTQLPFAAPEDSQARILVCRNRIFNNTTTPGADGFGFGGGIFASTLGFGMEFIGIEDNDVGPNNQGLHAGFATTFGGGISISAAPVNFGLHHIAVHDNTVIQNQADVGGGMDLLAVAESLTQNQSLSVTAENNTVENNQSVAEAGGLNVEFNSQRSLDLADEADVFPGADPFWVADAIDVIVSGNVVRNNTSGTAGAGAVLRPSADADPLGPSPCIAGEQRPATAIIDFEANYLEGNTAQATAGVGGRPGCSDPVCEAVICGLDSFCCDVEWDQTCANAAAVDPNCNCSTSDCCLSSVQEVIGAGVLAIPGAKGEALAAVEMTNSTLVDNTMIADGFVGGVEVASLTLPDCFDSFSGMTELNIDRCIVAHNHADGIGGPPFDPGVTDQTVNVIKTSSFGNGDTNPINDPDLDYEDTIFPSGPPPDNIFDDPLLDPVSFVPDLCSPVYDVGYCEASPTTVCIDDADCTAPPTDVCIAEGAGYLASPDINDDDAVDGVDLMRLSATFGADDDVDARYNVDADIDRNGMVDGADLPFIAPLFGQECTP
jgi:hypothetical protein